MVGVAGKSKGCKTCRKRKIACGLQRPICVQCVKSNRTCLGYDKDVRFIPVRANVTDRKLVVTSSFDEIRRTSLENRQTTSVLRKEAVQADAIPETCVDLTVSDKLCGSANRQQLISAFMTTCVPRHADGILDYSKTDSGPWVLLLPQLLMQTPALQASISAIAASAFGRQYGDRDMIKQSLKFYTTALRELQMSLWNPEVMYNDEVLAACLCLGLYEVMECPGDGRQAYYNHCKGCMRLVQGRGVGRHMSGVAHDLFLGLRAQGALISMASHEPSFLSSPEWMTEPWKLRSKSAMDLIVDCLCEASSIYQENDRISDLGPVDKLESWLRSLAKCWRMDSMLRGAYEDCEREFPQPMYWSVLSQDDNPADDIVRGKVFPVAYRFRNMKIARWLMMYWAVSFLVWTGLSLLYQGIASLEFDAEDAHCSSFPECNGFDDDMCHCKHFRLQASGSYKYDTSHFPSLGHRSDPKGLMDNVCQSVEYCFQPEIGVWGTWSVGTPLTMIYETSKPIPGWEREVAWMEATLRKLQQRGLRIINYTTTIPKSPDSQQHSRASFDLS